MKPKYVNPADILLSIFSMPCSGNRNAVGVGGVVVGVAGVIYQYLNTAIDTMTGAVGGRTVSVLIVMTMDRQTELNGTNSFERVTDAQLNSFPHYAVQEMKKKETYITISAVMFNPIIRPLILIPQLY
jgi:hypothetical protein